MKVRAVVDLSSDHNGYWTLEKLEEFVKDARKLGARGREFVNLGGRRLNGQLSLKFAPKNGTLQEIEHTLQAADIAEVTAEITEDED